MISPNFAPIFRVETLLYFRYPIRIRLRQNFVLHSQRPNIYTGGIIMNKRERVYAALHNQETDYVPGCFWRHYTIPMKKGQDIVEAHMEFYRETDVDFIKISSDGYFGWPEPTVKNVQHAEELYKMGHITLDHPFISDQIERVRRILKEEEADE